MSLSAHPNHCMAKNANKAETTQNFVHMNGPWFSCLAFVRVHSRRIRRARRCLHLCASMASCLHKIFIFAQKRHHGIPTATGNRRAVFRPQDSDTFPQTEPDQLSRVRLHLQRLTIAHLCRSKVSEQIIYISLDAENTSVKRFCKLACK